MRNYGAVKKESAVQEEIRVAVSVCPVCLKNTGKKSDSGNIVRYADCSLSTACKLESA